MRRLASHFPRPRTQIDNRGLSRPATPPASPRARFDAPSTGSARSPARKASTGTLKGAGNDPLIPVLEWVPSTRIGGFEDCTKVAKIAGSLRVQSSLPSCNLRKRPRCIATTRYDRRNHQNRKRSAARWTARSRSAPQSRRSGGTGPTEPWGAKGVPRCGPDAGTTPRTPSLTSVLPQPDGSCEGHRHNVTSRMPLTATSRSVGGLGGRPPRSTRPRTGRSRAWCPPN